MPTAQRRQINGLRFLMINTSDSSPQRVSAQNSSKVAQLGRNSLVG